MARINIGQQKILDRFHLSGTTLLFDPHIDRYRF